MPSREIGLGKYTGGVEVPHTLLKIAVPGVSSRALPPPSCSSPTKDWNFTPRLFENGGRMEHSNQS